MKNKIQNFDDVLNYHGIAAEDFAKRTEGLAPDTIAYEQSKLIVAAYNQNVEPNYNDLSQPKFEMRWRLGSSSGPVFELDVYGRWYSGSCCGARLSFLDLDNLYDAAEKFKPIFQKFYQIQ